MLSEDGFTMVELAMVVMILGIILAIAGLNYANISRGINMDGARKQLEAALNRAKTMARQENVSYQLVFYADSHGGNDNSYEFFCNVVTGVDAGGNKAWEMRPTDGSVSGEEVTQSGDHTFIKLSNGVKIIGSEEIAGDTITVNIVPSGTRVSIHGSGGNGEDTSSTVTLSLAIGGTTGSVSIDSIGNISSN